MATKVNREQIRDLIRRKTKEYAKEQVARPQEAVLEDVEVLSNRLSRRQIRQLVREQLDENRENYFQALVRDELKNFLRENLNEFDLSGMVTKALAAKAVGAAVDYGAEALSGEEKEVTAVAPSKPISLEDAKTTYEALEGLGTDDEDIRIVFQKRSSDLPALYDEFAQILTLEKDTDSGDLIDWLRDDGKDDEAETVAARLKAAGKSRVGGLN